MFWKKIYNFRIVLENKNHEIFATQINVNQIKSKSQCIKLTNAGKKIMKSTTH